MGKTAKFLWLNKCLKWFVDHEIMKENLNYYLALPGVNSSNLVNLEEQVRNQGEQHLEPEYKYDNKAIINCIWCNF